MAQGCSSIYPFPFSTLFPPHSPPRVAQSCSSVIFFEVRKKQDLYLWLAKSPAGPSVKFLVQNGEQRGGMGHGGNLRSLLATLPPLAETLKP